MEMLANIAGAMFVLGTMAAMGLGFSLDEILSPLRDRSLIIRALVANFLVLPLGAFIIVRLIDLESHYALAIALLALCAGSATLPKYVDIIGGDRPGSVGIMFLLTVATIIFMPLMLPIIVTGIEVDAGKVARNLALSTIVPLGIAILIRARYPALAEAWQPNANLISNIGLMVSIILQLVTRFSDVVALIGTGAIIAIMGVVLFGYGAGTALGRKSKPNERPLLGFATGQRNIAAALVVASTSFASTPIVLVVVVVGGLISNILLVLIASEMGKRVNIVKAEKEILE